jgi:fatty acid desaturase
MEKPLSSLVMVIPGIAFIALGVLIIIWPSVLPWLVAAACILAGGAILLMANFMHGVVPGSNAREASPQQPRSRHFPERSAVVRRNLTCNVRQMEE